MKTPVPLVIAAILLAASVHTLSSADAAGPVLEPNKSRSEINAMHGKPAPALTVTKWINAKPQTLADLKGKIVVLDFWATWCGPCIASIPHTNELQKKYADRGVVIIGICAANGGDKMGDAVKQHKISYPVALDTGATVKSYRVDGFPDYYIIDRKGNLRFGDFRNSDVEKAIEQLLAEK